MEKRILLTAFRNTSAELLLRGVTEYATLLLPNDKAEDSRMLLGMISREKYDAIISVGQRPNIKNKVHIETTAKKDGAYLVTELDCEKLRSSFEKHGICAKISHNAGTSYCNALYWNGLGHLSCAETDTRMVFVHIPFVKNIEDLADFRRRFLLAVNEWKERQEWTRSKN